MSIQYWCGARLCVLCLFLGACHEKHYVFCPKPDITAYEVALVLKATNNDPEPILKKHHELMKHVCEEAK